MKCPTCYKAGKQARAAIQAEADATIMADFELPALTGSEKQVAWATSLRLGMIAALHRADAGAVIAFLEIIEAKWWIDHRGVDLRTLASSRQAA